MYRLCLVVLFVAFWTCAILIPARAADEPKWDKVFGCEFKNKVDLKKWNLNDQVGRQPAADVQAYVKDAFHVHDGSLFIEARAQDVGGKQYTSGIMNTRGKFDSRFGKFEIRCRVPRGKGFQSQFSLVPVASKSGSNIGLLDVVGSNVSFSKKAHSDEPIEVTIEQDLSDDFHTISVVWLETSIVWALDGKEVMRAKKDLPNEKMFMVVNLAVKSGEDAQTHFPNALEIDYIKAYQSPSK